MSRVLPPKRHWAWIALGVLIVAAINILLAVPFLATTVTSLLLSRLAYRMWTPRGFFGFMFWLGGAELLVLGALILLGVGLVAAFSAAAAVAVELLSLPVGWELALVLIAAGLVLFFVGNLVAD